MSGVWHDNAGAHVAQDNKRSQDVKRVYGQLGLDHQSQADQQACEQGTSKYSMLCKPGVYEFSIDPRAGDRAHCRQGK
ncbi:hypothetical protein D3C81_2094640 [compost metagenome]